MRFSDPSLVTLPASTDKEVYTWVKGGTEDLVVTVDIHNGTYVSFSGGGISSSQYKYAPGENTTVGTITISKSYLNGKKAGSYTYTIRTTNVEEETFTCTFKIQVKNADEEDDSSSGSESAPAESISAGDNTSSGGGAGGETTSGGKGCKGALGGIGLFSLAGMAAAVCIAKKKNK